MPVVPVMSDQPIVPGEERALAADIARVKEARLYTVEHFGFSKTSFVGKMPSNEFDRAVDHIVEFADWASDLLSDLFEKPGTHEGLRQDIGYALGILRRWRCECGDLNGAHEGFCYRCGAGRPEADDATDFDEPAEQEG